MSSLFDYLADGVRIAIAAVVLAALFLLFGAYTDHRIRRETFWRCVGALAFVVLLLGMLFFLYR